MALMSSLAAFAVIAWIISDKYGYGASSEGKINFLRATVYFVTLMQLMLAFFLRKMISAAKNANPSMRMTLQIVVNIFCEIIALSGLALVFISKNFTDYVIFGIISAAAFLIFFPQRDQWLSNQNGRN